MDEPILLDTSAIFALAEDEPGADEVEAILTRARAAEIQLHGSFVTLTELDYITTQERGPEAAAELLAIVRSWPVRWHHSDDALCAEAAALKAAHRISFADAFVAATALRCAARLVHRDPEFDTLSAILPTRMLPPKTPAKP